MGLYAQNAYDDRSLDATYYAVIFPPHIFFCILRHNLRRVCLNLQKRTAKEKTDPKTGIKFPQCIVQNGQ